MLKLIDTHSHLFLSQFEEDLDQVIAQARQVGVEKIYLPNIDSTTIEQMLHLENTYKNYCFSMMGLHPCYVKEDYKKSMQEVESWLGKRKFCAIGEVGIDLYWDTTFKKEQIIAFERQLEWGRSLNLPVIIHCRASMDLAIELVQKHQDGNLNGIFHCFSGSPEQAQQIIDLNFSLGIGGVVTFKNGGLDKVIPQVSLEHIVLETDAPYLAPAPFRGKRNAPALLTHIVEKIADLKNTSPQEVASITTHNANMIFKNEL